MRLRMRWRPQARVFRLEVAIEEEEEEEEKEESGFRT